MVYQNSMLLRKLYTKKISNNRTYRNLPKIS